MVDNNNILLVGKPNAGKTLLFNRLTGLNQKVSNFPGVTVEIKKGKWNTQNIIDFPGTYSLNPISLDEKVASEEFEIQLKNEMTKIIMVVIDATKIERSLVFALQAINKAKNHNKLVLVIANMIDEVNKKQGHMNFQILEKAISTPVIPISAKTMLGLDILKNQVNDILNNETDYKQKLKNQITFSNQLTDQNEILNLAKKINQELNNGKELSFLKDQIKIDNLILSKILGPIIFFGIMFLLFQSIFAWADPFMGLIEEIVALTGEKVASLFSNEHIINFINDAIFSGIGAFVVFVPQIFILSFIIGILEDSGYLSRATILSHQFLSFFGLTGKSFVPYLTGFACAIPAIMATRTIESKKKRLISILTIPLLACSARLPVYALLISALIPMNYFLFGSVNSRGIAFFILYVFGIFISLIISSMLSKFIKGNKQEDNQFIIELPPYRIPHLKPILKNSYNNSISFITKAGPIIFAVSVIIWFLGYFPNGDGNLSNSYLSYIGRIMEPLFAPMNLDWKFSIAIFTSFLAREVFVSTLGTLYGIENVEENLASLTQTILNNGVTFASGMALLVFFAVALQCVSTVAMIKKETGSTKLATFSLVGYNLLAYFLALITYYVLR